MILAMDARALMDAPTGIGRLTAQYAQTLLMLPEVHVVFYAFGGRKPSAALGALLAHPRAKLVHHPLPMRAMRQAWRRFGAPRLERVVGPFDIAIASETTCPATTRPVIAVVHDALFMTHPHWFNAYTRGSGPENLADAAARATIAVTTCHTTARAILGHAPALADRLVVAPPIAPAAPRAARQGGARADAGRARDTVLFVGTREPRKGLGTLARAMLRSAGPAGRATLHVVGKVQTARIPGADALSVLDAQGRVHVHDWITDARLARLRARATIAAIPAEAEGFGLPLLESLAVGLPTVASDIPVFREIAGSAAHYAAPRAPDVWADALDALLASPDAQKDCRAAGYARSAAFNQAQQTAAWQAALARVEGHV